MMSSAAAPADTLPVLGFVPDLVIFDCDGVLIDSEPVSARVVAAQRTALGLPTSAEEAQQRFVGMSLMELQTRFGEELGQPLPDHWRDTMVRHIVAAMRQEARLIEGAREVLEALAERGVPWRIASNSADVEMEAKFARTGLLALTDGRTHAAPRLAARGGRPKPAPDVFLDAAAAEGAAPARCIVIEDSVTGMRGAVAAGMTGYGFAPEDEGARLLEAGARGIIRALRQVPQLIPATAR